MPLPAPPATRDVRPSLRRPRCSRPALPRCAAAPLVLTLAAGLAGCGEGAPDETSPTTTSPTTTTTPPELPPPLDPLPPVVSTKTEQFATSGTCNQCHLGGESELLHDAEGHDISPAYLWRSSMMAFAARDPYYLAVFSEARASIPGAEATVDAACLRCHAPAGSVENGTSGADFGFEAITAGTGAAAHLGRDGVTCSLCHQIQPDNLGKSSSFSGGFEVGFGRKIYGPHKGPDTQPMTFFVDYTPTYAPHVTSSELCATCHTVVVPFLDEAGEPTGKGFVEQATYAEWQSSAFAPGQPCGQCHLPTAGEDGLPLSSPIAKYPAGLAARSPFGQHSFEGGNAYMLGLLAENIEWTGSDLAPAELTEAAQRAERHLQTAADVSVVSADLAGDERVVVVEVVNRTGHKLPTGYPSRRVWIHLTAEDAAGKVLFESGRPGPDGSIESNGVRVDKPGAVLPHRDDVSKGQAQVYEAVAVDAGGAPTHRPLSQVTFGKDNRLLPDGWSPAGPLADWIGPVGVAGDATFAAGKDRVRYHVPNGAKVARVTVELLYQTLPREAADALAVTPTPAAVRFSQMVAARPPRPVVMASATWE